jgi:hypothetical protein
MHVHIFFQNKNMINYFFISKNQSNSFLKTIQNKMDRVSASELFMKIVVLQEKQAQLYKLLSQKLSMKN